MLSDVQTAECPVSLTSQESLVVIGIHNRAERLKDIANILGDGSELPAALVDSLELLKREGAETDAAIAEHARSGAVPDDVDTDY